MSLGSLAGLAGGILGGIGGSKGKGATTVEGFASLGKDQKAFAEGPLWDMVMNIFNRPYEGMPKRRLNAEDLDPVFGSKARQDLQGWNDARLAASQGGLSAIGNPQMSSAASQEPKYVEETAAQIYGLAPRKGNEVTARQMGRMQQKGMI